MSGCVDLAEVGECTRSAAYMLSHCAAACAAEAVANAARAEAAAGADGGEGTSEVESSDSDGFHTQESCTQYNALKLNQAGPAAAARQHDRLSSSGAHLQARSPTLLSANYSMGCSASSTPRTLGR